MTENKTIKAGHTISNAPGLLNYLRAVASTTATEIVFRSATITSDSGKVLSITYPDGETARFEYVHEQLQSALVRGREFVFDSESDLFKELHHTDSGHIRHTIWHDLKVVQSDTPRFLAGTVILEQWGLLEVIAPLLCYKVWFRNHGLIDKIAYPNQLEASFEYCGRTLIAVRWSTGKVVSVVERDQQPDDQTDFARATVSTLFLPSKQHCEHFGSLVVSTTRVDPEVIMLYRLDGTVVVREVKNGACLKAMVIATDGSQLTFVQVSPGLALCEETGQVVPMPDYSHLFPDLKD